jgi:hypothetical protein
VFDPGLAITAPADGATITTVPVAVTGTVTGGFGVALSVDGRPTPIAPDGSFSASVNLARGPNTITAIAQGPFGGEATVQLDVTYDPFAGLPTGQPAVHQCVVPPVAGLILGRARRAIADGGCSIGRLRHRRSRTVPSGRIIAATLPAGTVAAIGTAVALTQSSGRPKPRPRPKRPRRPTRRPATPRGTGV